MYDPNNLPTDRIEVIDCGEGNLDRYDIVIDGDLSCVLCSNEVGYVYHTDASYEYLDEARDGTRNSIVSELSSLPHEVRRAIAAELNRIDDDAIEAHDAHNDAVQAHLENGTWRD